MKFKPAKSRSLLLVKGKLDDEARFIVGGQAIPTISEEPVKSLGRWYDSSMKDTKQAQAVIDSTKQGLEINQTIDR